MKRLDLIRHMESYGCRLVREGGRHSIYSNPSRDRLSAVPRHREIKKHLARIICRDLGIPEPEHN
ncbi:MAG: type II toxin-antitoxin system HicA family toxin [Candidatus Korobacteraceae bacterium]